MLSTNQARISHIMNHILFLAGVFLALHFSSLPVHSQAASLVLASKSISLENRYPNKTVSDVFKDNILLTIAYMAGIQDKTKPVDWTQIEKPFAYDFTLKPNETFAFHDTGLLSQYASHVVKTTNSHYNSTEGFKSDGYLMGDGVCQLASLLYWATKGTNIEAVAPVNHDFAAIPEIDKQFGVAIFADPNNPAISAQQNLYIRNNQNVPITFRIVYNGKDLTVEILKEI